MEMKDIKELIGLINSSDIALFELNNGDISVKMDKSLNRLHAENTVENPTVASPKEVKVIKESLAKNDVSAVNKAESNIDTTDENLIEVKSPMVGTFYGASAPGKPSFVSEGTVIKQGDILCIVEAMKLMNEIEAEVSGEIVKVLAKDGDMVEYGQPLFKVKRG